MKDISSDTLMLLALEYLKTHPEPQRLSPEEYAKRLYEVGIVIQKTIEHLELKRQSEIPDNIKSLL